MKYIWITFIILVSVFVACEVWAIQQFTHLPDAVVEENLLKKVKEATREGKILRLQMYSLKSHSITYLLSPT
jgi:hypothetical protein